MFYWSLSHLSQDIIGFFKPIYPGMTDKEVDYVIENIVDIVRKMS